MSLDVTLTAVRPTEVFSANITHNVGKMAEEAGIYKHLWRPEELGITTAKELIEPLTEGLVRLRSNPKHYEQFEPENKWGTVGSLTSFVADYLHSCKLNPDALISVSR